MGELIRSIPMALFPKRSGSIEVKKEGKDQESIQSSTTLDPGYQWESDNFTIRHHKQAFAYCWCPDVPP